MNVDERTRILHEVQQRDATKGGKWLTSTHLQNKLLSIKSQKNEKDFIFFPIILKGFSWWDSIIKIHVLDINALFNMHVIEYWDNSILY
jgi:hypothetical protein